MNLLQTITEICTAFFFGCRCSGCRVGYCQPVSLNAKLPTATPSLRILRCLKCRGIFCPTVSPDTEGNPTVSGGHCPASSLRRAVDESASCALFPGLFRLFSASQVRGAVQALEHPRAHLLEPGCVFARVLCLRWRKRLHSFTVAPRTASTRWRGIFYSPRSSVKVSPSTETVRLRSKRRNFQTLPLPYLWA